MVLLFSLVISNTHAASYPDFTNIVEQNMPAVVIVNATRTMSANNGPNDSQIPPGMPDEFNDLFKKFFDDKQKSPKKDNLAQAQVLFFQATVT